jgi:hypothetical protein
VALVPPAWAIGGIVVVRICAVTHTRFYGLVVAVRLRQRVCVWVGNDAWSSVTIIGPR